MEKMKVLILSCAILLPAILNAQSFHKPPFVKKTLMKMSTGLTFGVQAFNPVQEVFFTGSFSYNMEDQIGIRSDLYVFLPDYNFEGQLQKNSSILLGPEFHFPFHRFDIVLLFEPGIAFPYYGSATETKVQAEPVMLLSLSTYYYFFQNFHMFASAGYLHGNYFLEGTAPYKLDELRITAGLGINIFVNHQPAFQRKRTKF